LPESSAVNQKFLTTLDLDWTVPKKLPLHGRKTVDELLQDAQFVSVLRGDESRVFCYQDRRYGHRELAPIHIEFLSPRLGSPSGRRGEDRTSIQVQKGLWAQGLPYLELLLHEPLEVDAQRVPQLGVSEHCLVRVPNPAAYIAQKTLARPKRTREKRDKDLAYIFDAATALHKSWAEIAGQVGRVAGRFPKKWCRTIRSTLGTLFASPTADGPIAVAQQYRDAMGPNAPGEEAIFRVMTRFLSETGFMLEER